MRWISTILFSGVVALGVADGATAQDMKAQSPQQIQAGPHGDRHGSPPHSVPGSEKFGVRSGPSAGGVAGTIDSVSPSGFTIATSAGAKVTVETASSTTYQKGAGSTSALPITKGENVLVLGTVRFGTETTITANHVVVPPAGGRGPATSVAAGVVGPFQRDAPSTAKQVGQIPANYTQGSGKIVSGEEAQEATEAALAISTGGIVNRVVKLTNGEYEVHNIGVNWPHHIFVNHNFKVVGAD